MEKNGKIFLDEKKTWGAKIIRPKKNHVKKIFPPKKYGAQRFFDPKNFLNPAPFPLDLFSKHSPKTYRHLYRTGSRYFNLHCGALTKGCKATLRQIDTWFYFWFVTFHNECFYNKKTKQTNHSWPKSILHLHEESTRVTRRDWFEPKLQMN